MAYNSLSELFTAIADAIRSKTGSTEPIVANDFPAAIDSISAGGSEHKGDPVTVKLGDQIFEGVEAVKLDTVDNGEAVFTLGGGEADGGKLLGGWKDLATSPGAGLNTIFLVEGKTYTVETDVGVFTSVCKKNLTLGEILYIGNGSLAIAGCPDTGEPFVYFEMYPEEMGICDHNGLTTFLIYDGEPE